MELALLGALLVGVLMGLLGAGGAIMTIPILVYLLGHPEKQAIAEGMAIVGCIAVAGAIRAASRRELAWPVVALYALPGMVGSAAGAWASHWVAGALQLMMLATLMIGVAVLMARAEGGDVHPRPATGHLATTAQGFGVGSLTGLLGVGGGFMIVPMLVLIRGMEMPLAVGTSLGVIALNSAAGLGKLLYAGTVTPDWPVVAIFSAAGMVGSFVGGHIATKLDRNLVRRAFSVMLVVMAIYIGAREVPPLLDRQPPHKEAHP